MLRGCQECDAEAPAAEGVSSLPQVCDNYRAVCSADGFLQFFTSPVRPFPVIWASASWLSFVGCESSELMGRSLATIMSPMISPVSLETLDSAASGSMPWSGYMLLMTRASEPFCHKVSMDPLHDNEGTMRCLQFVVSELQPLARDKTQQKRSRAASPADYASPAKRVPATTPELKAVTTTDLRGGAAELQDGSLPPWESRSSVISSQGQLPHKDSEISLTDVLDMCEL